MKKIFLLLFSAVFVFVCWPGYSGTPRKLDDQSAKDLIARFDQYNSGVKSVDCQFIQTRRSDMIEGDMVSSGKIQIKYPSRIEIEMTAPYRSRIVLDSQKAGKSSSPIMSVIAPMMRGGLLNNKDLSAVAYSDGNYYIISLIPSDYSIRAFVGEVNLKINQDCTVSCVEIMDASGGYTKMEFSQIKIVRDGTE